MRSSLESAGISTDEGEPEVQTYNAFASAIIREQGLRIGLEPDMQVLTAAKRFQLAANVVQAHEGALTRVSHDTPTVIKDMLALDGQLSEHLVSTDELREEDAALIAEIESLGRQLKAQFDEMFPGVIDAEAARYPAFEPLPVPGQIHAGTDRPGDADLIASPRDAEDLLGAALEFSGRFAPKRFPDAAAYSP